MLTNFLKWLKPEIIQETEESVLVKHALENNDVNIDENDAILFDKGLAGYGIFGQRQEALVLDYTTDDVQVTYNIKGNKKTRWIPIYSITSNLGDEYWSEEELLAIGLTNPKPQRAPNKPLLSGTYINEREDEYGETEFSLVEIEKVNGQYYIHNAGNSNCEPINQDHDYNLQTFSTPEEGTYILDPGLYIRTDKKLLEIIPFKGKCWVRHLDYHILEELNEHEALKLTRVETDEPTPAFYIINEPEETQEPDEPDEYLEPYKVPETTGYTCNKEKCCGNPNECNPTDPI